MKLRSSIPCTKTFSKDLNEMWLIRIFLSNRSCCRSLRVINPAERPCTSCGGGVVEKVIARQLKLFGHCSRNGVIRIAWIRKAGAVSSPLPQNNLSLSHFRLEQIGEREEALQKFYAMMFAVGHSEVGIIGDVEQESGVDACEAAK